MALPLNSAIKFYKYFKRENITPKESIEDTTRSERVPKIHNSDSRLQLKDQAGAVKQ